MVGGVLMGEDEGDMKEMVGGCCVCSDESGWDENPLVYCDGDGCNVAVHQACYGIVSVPPGPWFCRKCESQERAARVRCELCPSKGGALKRTDQNGWAHVVCALYIPEVRFGDVATMEPILVSIVPPDRFSKSCCLCELHGRASKAQAGACMSCNKPGCRLSFHVTCAQGHGLLCEEQVQSMNNVTYCGYCPHHYAKLKRGHNVKPIPAFKPGNDSALAEAPPGKPPPPPPPPAEPGRAERKSKKPKPGAGTESESTLSATSDLDVKVSPHLVASKSKRPLPTAAVDKEPRKRKPPGRPRNREGSVGRGEASPAAAPRKRPSGEPAEPGVAVNGRSSSAGSGSISIRTNGLPVAAHMLGNQLNPSSLMAPKLSDSLAAELAGGSAPPFPQSLSELLERQWEQGSHFLMEQSQHFDVAALLSCLYQLRQENEHLEEHMGELAQRRDHLLAVNARLSLPLESTTPLGAALGHHAGSPRPPLENGLTEPAAAAADRDHRILESLRVSAAASAAAAAYPQYQMVSPPGPAGPPMHHVVHMPPPSHAHRRAAHYCALSIEYKYFVMSDRDDQQPAIAGAAREGALGRGDRVGHVTAGLGQCRTLRLSFWDRPAAWEGWGPAGWL
ncbi:protein AF-10-like [Pollicipes pollicipes]|uniref:protein AF-10-like n=1 Tax=Pollicipes pollicipes TaxID=41117 RepID=UPI001884F574|nr:protein AF-10-like [Pollicipes pollicipes]